MPADAQINALKAVANGLALTAPPQRVTDFIASRFGLNATQLADLVTTGFDGASLAEWTAYLTQQRQELLDIQGIVPSYVIYSDVHGVDQMAGLKTYLAYRNADPNSAEAKLGARIEFHGQIRSAISALKQGHHLEAVGAAILTGLAVRGKATKGSGDQGIDFIGKKSLIELEAAFRSGGIPKVRSFPGDSTFVLGSSKAARNGNRPVLSPVAVRELVGGWLIQRSQAGLWREQGIQLLSPIQMVLLTTYRLSDDAKRLCNALGVQVWNFPETIALVCLSAPASVFNEDVGTPQFLPDKFRAWWNEFQCDRLAAPVAAS